MNKNVLKKVGNCAKLETLILNGSTSFGDDGIGQLAHGNSYKSINSKKLFNTLQVMT